MANDLKHITQHVIVVKTESEKLYRLQELLEELGDKTALVFTNTKKSADSLTKALNKAGGGGDEKKKKKKKGGGYRVTTIHGDKSPSERAISSHDFSAKIYNVLVSTEEAARGIELPHGVDVINYDLPANIDIYIKQTGRAGNKTGIATTFFSTLGLYCWYDNDKVLGDITQMLIQSNSPVPPELRGRYGKRIC